MGIDTLLSLQRAAPVLLRHLVAYAELAEQDLAVSRVELAARVRASVSLVISAIFALMMICACVLAATWDTPYRLAAVICMALLFAVAAGVSAMLLTKVAKQRAFAGVRGEWQRDRLLLEQLMSQPQVGNAAFPRSRTMRMLTEHPGLAVTAILVGGALILNPGTLQRVTRAIPVAAVSRMLLMRYLARTLS